MSTPYEVRYTLPNPILAGGSPQFWMIQVSFLAVVTVSDQPVFAAKTGTDDLDAGFKKWLPMVAVYCQNDISEAAATASGPEAVLARKAELESKILAKVAKMSESYGLTVHHFEFETFGRPADEANRLRQMGLA